MKAPNNQVLELGGKMNIKFAMLAIIAVSSPVTAQSQSTMLGSAKAIISDRMVDPSSLQFKNVKTVAGPALCGEYNAKNRMGGYNGFVKFIFDPKTETVTTIEGNFYSDAHGDFSLDEFSSRKPSSLAEAQDRIAEFNVWADRIKNDLMRCA